MMIDVTVADGFTGELAGAYTHMNPLSAGAAMLSQSATQVVFETADHQRFTVTGTGLVVSLVEGVPQITGGAVDALVFGDGAAALVTFANLQTTGEVLWQAFATGADGSDPGALTDLLSHHCWTYHGSAGDDLFGRTETAVGELDLKGNDRVYLNGGNDLFFTGSANDTVFGGAGDDSVAGGLDLDRLFGGAGNDVLNGGAGNDLLIGGSGDDWALGSLGDDTLTGGLGRDKLCGGGGSDLLCGGAGGDVFVFGLGTGRDVIRDYQPGIDHLLGLGGVIPVITVEGGDALIRFGAEEVLLLGVAPGGLTAGDFL